MTKAIVMFSGGQDSTTCLFLAKTMFDEVRALSVFYGQRHAAELDAATRIAALAGVPHEVVPLPALGALGGSALVTPGAPISATGGAVDREAPHGLPTSFVPGRNTLFLTIASAVAVKWGAKDIVTGVCQTDYSGYPDCRREFIDSLERTLSLGMASMSGPVRIHTPLMWMTKAETVTLAKRLPGCWEALAETVTCYEGLRPGCGACPACKLRREGFREAGLEDPARWMAPGGPGPLT